MRGRYEMREGVHGRIPPVPRESRRGDLWEKSPPGGTGHRAQSRGHHSVPLQCMRGWGSAAAVPLSLCPSTHTALGAKSPLPRLCPCPTPPCSGFGAHGSEQNASSPQRHRAGVGWAGHGGSWFPIPSPCALHVGAQPDAWMAPAPSCWETLCSHPTGRRCPPAAVSAAFC